MSSDIDLLRLHPRKCGAPDATLAACVRRDLSHDGTTLLLRVGPWWTALNPRGVAVVFKFLMVAVLGGALLALLVLGLLTFCINSWTRFISNGFRLESKS